VSGGAAAPAATGVYVYGVVAGDPPAVGAAGVGEQPAPVRAIAGAGSAAVVSDVPASWRAARRQDVEAHDRVVAELVGAGAVVPLRFGTVFASDDEVRERLLERHADELKDLLVRLRGHVQMTLRAYYVEDALLRAVLTRRPQLKARADALEGRPEAATQPERIALGRDVADAVEEQRALDQEMLVQALAGLAAELQVDQPASERQAASLQLLVAEGDRPRLDAAVDRLGREHAARLSFRYVGPLAPYSFSDLAFEA
jgi:Gas vesicle synthesis protein GvpL/GvpF